LDLGGGSGGSWMKLRNEELHNLHTLKEDEMGRVCSTHWRDVIYIQDFGQKT